MIIPIIVGFIFLNEEFTINKFIGISFSLIAIYLSSLRNGKIRDK